MTALYAVAAWLLRTWLVRITDIVAVPIEPAVCWMMFIIVEPRAIW